MQLTQEQILKLGQMEHFLECPNCGSKDVMQIDTNAYRLVPTDQDGNNVFMREYSNLPMIAATCDKCSYVKLFNLGKLKLMLS